MRYFIVMMILLFTIPVFAGETIPEQLRDTAQMTESCVKNINYYKDKITKYELYVNLKTHQKLKLAYYRNELMAWEDYCYNGNTDSEFE